MLRCEHCGSSILFKDDDKDTYCFICGRYQTLVTETPLKPTLRTCSACGESLPVARFPNPRHGVAYQRARPVCTGCGERRALAS